MLEVNESLYVELWVSLASLLRSYTAAHGLNKDRQATVELGEERIMVRHGDAWLDLERDGALVRWRRQDGTPQDRDAPSDGYATGLVLYVLRLAGVAATEKPIRRGVAWLKANQRESGRWFTFSLNNDRAHYITNAGTAYAVLALQACDALKD